jgi:hypothetical protein
MGHIIADAPLTDGSISGHAPDNSLCHNSVKTFEMNMADIKPKSTHSDESIINMADIDCVAQSIRGDTKTGGIKVLAYISEYTKTSDAGRALGSLDPTG